MVAAFHLSRSKMRHAATTDDEVAKIIEETLSYLLLYAPDFPEEDCTTTEAQFDQLLLQVQQLWSQIQDVEQRRWLDLAGQELVEARRLFLSGESSAGGSLIQSVQERLKSWRDGRKPRAAFIVGPGGETGRFK
jgi:hypothetical protein